MSIFKVSNGQTVVKGPRAAGQFIVARDPGMSGWGDAKDGTSYAVWACDDRDANAVLAWVKARSDMVGVRIQHGTLATSAGDHVHIYEVGDSHPAVISNSNTTLDKYDGVPADTGSL